MKEKVIQATGLPFWSWNDELEVDKLVKQINEMHKNGYGGFFMHARSGLKTEYLKDKWFDCVRACCEKAKKLGMQAWLYDENGWPSGFVGGKLLDTKEFRLHYFTHTEGMFDEKADYHYLVKGDELKRVEEPVDGTFINVFDNESVSMVDVLDENVVDAFIRETHEKYKKELNDISSDVVGFFTDEPQYCQLGGAPYPKRIHAYFEENYGEKVLDKLGLLFAKKKGYEQFRYRYFKGCQTLFLNNFAKKLYDWHEENGLQFTGHYVEERTMFTQMLNNAGIMPYYEFMHMPGIDWLCRRYLRVSTIRQLTSVASQLGKERALTETFAMSGWDVTPKELKSIADYQYNYGVNIMCQHLLPYSERGERKNDYPAHFTPLNAWYSRGIKEFNEYFDALGQWIRDGKENVHVGVLCTIRSAYLDYDYSNWDSTEDLDISYIMDGCENLANHRIAFHIVDETLLGKYGGVQDGNLTVGNCAYDTLVIPKAYVIDKTTDNLLRAFVSQGGKVLLLGEKPYLVEGVPGNFDYLESTTTWEEIYATNEYKVSSDCPELHTSLRTVNGKQYIFAVNVGEEEIVTSFSVDNVNFNAVYNVVNDEIRYVGNYFTIPPKESLIVCRFEGERPLIPSFETVEIGTGEYSVVNYNANYLALDFASLSYDGVHFEEPMPVVGIFRKLIEKRFIGDIALKFNFTVKEVPTEISLLMEDAEKVNASLNGQPIVFNGVSELDEIYSTANLAGKVIKGDNELLVKCQFYQNENVYYALFGEGVSESLRNCMTYDTMLTVPYLSGKFGVYSDNFRKGDKAVSLHADSFYIGASPRKVVNLVENGFPFFAGNIMLKRTFHANFENVKLKLNGRFHYAEITVNSKFAGTLMFTDIIDVSPYIQQGENRLEVKLYSGNRNLLGPHHVVDKDIDNEVVPSSFDFSESWSGDSSPEFTARYSFIKFGLFDEKA